MPAVLSGAGSPEREAPCVGAYEEVYHANKVRILAPFALHCLFRICVELVQVNHSCVCTGTDHSADAKYAAA